MAPPYENAVPPQMAGVNFQPQVPDTSNGPEVHFYVPRHDNSTSPCPGFGFPFGPQMVPLQPFQFQPLQPIAVPLMVSDHAG